MKRIQLSTLMLLVIIAALGLALVVQDQRAKRREAALQAQLALKEHTILAPFQGIVIEHVNGRPIAENHGGKGWLKRLTADQENKNQGR